MTKPAFRPYKNTDRAACMVLFESNCPTYFAPEERVDYEAFLDALDCDYSVLTLAEDIVGCGGFHVNRETGQGKLCWGMVDQSHHKSGLGKALLEFRLAGIKANPDATHVHIDTSQLSAPFYAKFGFKQTHKTKDGYGTGIDHIEMILDW